MKKMNTITINGVVYTVDDPDAAHINDDVVGSGAWSSKNTLDKLCPKFSEVGTVATCEPLAECPADVTTRIPSGYNAINALTLTHTGKNLWDFKSGLSQCTGISGSTGNEVVRYGYIVTLPPGTYTVSGEVVAGSNYIYFNPINIDTLLMGALTSKK